MGELILLKNGEEAYMKPDRHEGNLAKQDDQSIIDFDNNDEHNVGQWPSSVPQTISMLLARTWYDPVFKTAFIANPMNVVKSLNIELPEGTTLYVDESRGKCRVTVYEYNPRTHRHKRGMTLKLNLTAGVF